MQNDNPQPPIPPKSPYATIQLNLARGPRPNSWQVFIFMIGEIEIVVNMLVKLFETYLIIWQGVVKVMSNSQVHKQLIQQEAQRADIPMVSEAELDDVVGRIINPPPQE